MYILRLKSASGVKIDMEVNHVLNGRGLVIGEASKIIIRYDGKIVLECPDTKEFAGIINETIDTLKEDKNIKGESLLVKKESKKKGGKLNGYPERI